MSLKSPELMQNYILALSSKQRPAIIILTAPYIYAIALWDLNMSKDSSANASTEKVAAWNKFSSLFGQILSNVYVWIVIIYTAISIFIPQEIIPTFRFATSALASTAPYIILAAFAVGYLSASGATSVIGERLKTGSLFTILVAACIGAFVPLCSCEVIPIVAALLLAGVPLSVVMAFWLASPLMDPAALLITASALGWEFAVGKTLAALGVGLLGGLVIYLIERYSPNFLENTIRSSYNSCGACAPKQGKPVWKFWIEDDRVAVFKSQFLSNFLLLIKWLALAYTLEALMVKFLPGELIISLLGDKNSLLSILIGAVLGAPAYLNGYAAPTIVSGFVSQGMSIGAAMSFLVAGGVTSIPAMTAVFAIATPRVFVSYLVLGLAGAFFSGVIFLVYGGVL